ncbi:MAG: hypothetical protein IT555_04410 [Acetobacteraceae bacterium]|nr:hypothetical protein [Acetobacteraceae bacterium]
MAVSGMLALVRVMTQAERLRWRLMLRRGALRGGLLLGGVVFLCAALAMLHVLAVAALTRELGWITALGIVTAADLVVGLSLVLVAVRLRPGNAERTALALRETARGELAGRTRALRLLATLLAMSQRK